MLALFAQCLPQLHDVFGECGGRYGFFDDDEEETEKKEEGKEEDETEKNNTFPLADNTVLDLRSFGDNPVIVKKIGLNVDPVPPAVAPPVVIVPPSDPVRSNWVTREGAAIPASFWSSDAYRRLRWAANPKRNPLCRNSQSIREEGPSINNLLVSTPEGTFYLGWSAAYDGFRYFGNSSNVRRLYLELAALKFARMFPTVLPDADVQLPDPNMTDVKRFIANEAGLLSLQKEILSNSVTDDLLRQGKERREKAAAEAAATRALVLEKTGARGMLEALEQRKRAARALADADPTRLVVDDMIVARDWCPELRALWLDRTLGTLSFQYGGKLESIFTTPKNARYGGWSKAEALRREGQRRSHLRANVAVAAAAETHYKPIICVNRNAAVENHVSSSSSSSVMYQVDGSGGVTYVGGKYRVDLRNVTGLTMQEFLAEKARRIQAFIESSSKNTVAEDEDGDEDEDEDDSSSSSDDAGSSSCSSSEDGSEEISADSDAKVVVEDDEDEDEEEDEEDEEDELVVFSKESTVRGVLVGRLMLDVWVSVTATWKPDEAEQFSTVTETRELVRKVCTKIACNIACTPAVIREMRSHIAVSGVQAEYRSTKTLEVPLENGGNIEAVIVARFTPSTASLSSSLGAVAPATTN